MSSESYSSFDAWMEQVDATLLESIGLESQDFQDVEWRNKYDMGESPEEAAFSCMEDVDHPNFDPDEFL